MNLLQRAIAVCTLTFACAVFVNAGDFDGWDEGRATFYGDDGGTTIYEGSCMMDMNKVSTGKDIGALSDTNPDYKGSCGRCYEVACRSTHLKDGYGNDLDRTGTCQGQKSVIITITDTCPCYYPSNQYSNTRWCCGDVHHMDLSKWAFEKIGRSSDGVMGIYYRVVECPGSRQASGCDHNQACFEDLDHTQATSSSYAWASSDSSDHDSSSSGNQESGSGGDNKDDQNNGGGWWNGGNNGGNSGSNWWSGSTGNHLGWPIGFSKSGRKLRMQ